MQAGLIFYRARPATGEAEAAQQLVDVEEVWQEEVPLVRVGRISGRSQLLAAAKHNKRTMYADGAYAKDIDKKRTHLNYSVAGPQHPHEVVQRWTDARASAGIFKAKRKDEVSAIEVVFSLNAATKVPLGDYFEACTTFAANRFGGAQNLLSSDVHLDQAQPHCHVLLVPLLDGRMQGSHLFWGKSRGFADLHTAFFEEVGSKFGLTRRQGPQTREMRQDRVRRARAALTAMPDDATRWQAVEAAVAYWMERDPQPILAYLGLEAPLQRGKTFENFALSRGAGPRTAAAEASRDAGFLARAPARFTSPRPSMPPGQTLPCVAFDSETISMAPAAVSTTRAREGD